MQSPAAGAGKAAPPKPRPAAPAAPLATATPLRESEGDAALGLSPGSHAPSRGLNISPPDDPAEREADRMADRAMRWPTAGPWASPPTQPAGPGMLQRKASAAGAGAATGPAALGGLGAGEAMSPRSLAFFEPRLGARFDHVRVHNDPAAHRSAAQLQARAYAYGHHLVFGARQFAPETATGGRLVAHELAHVMQQQAAPSQPATLHRDPLPGGTFRPPGSQAVSDVPGALPGDAMDPTSGIDVDEVIRIAAPLLPGARAKPDDAEQRYHLHSAVISQTPISVYAVPRTWLSLDAAGQVPASGASTSTPVTVTPPNLAAGSQVYGANRLPLAVLGADAANVVVESSIAVHHAVGAGSCLLVRTNGGWYLFDAGINITESHAMADAVVARIVARVGGEAIRGVFLTHAHYDHVSLLSRLARWLQIDHIIANPQQFTYESYATARESIRTNDLLRRGDERARIEADVEARRSFTETLERSGSIEALHPDDLTRLWREEVARRVEALYPELRESTAVPLRGGNNFDTVGTRPLHGVAEVASVPMEDILPSRDGTTLRGVVDKSLHGRTEMAEHEVDRMSTTYVLTVNGNRLVVMPDLRRTDINRIRTELREALGGAPVEFQEWVLGHHTQIGFMEGVVSARALRKTLQLLHDFRAAGRAGHAGRDAVVASVDAAQVDAAQIRLLRLLGFETYLARSQADVQSYEIMSRGRLLRGVRAPLAPGATGEPTLRRSMAGVAEMERELQRLRGQRRRSGPRAEATALRDRITDLNTRIGRIRQLEHRLIDVARAVPHDSAAVAAAEQVLNAALDAEGLGRVVTSSSAITDTALVLLREPLGPEPAADSPEGRRRALDLELREHKSRVDVLREHAETAAPDARQGAYSELYAELAEYEHRLRAEAEASSPGVLRDLLHAELERVRGDRGALEGSFREGDAVRLPDGQLVESRLVRIAPPEGAGRAGGPSPLARNMMRGLNAVGRPLGAFMVYTTIRGSKELIDRYADGQVNLAQLGIGGLHAATGGVVGVRMLIGRRVHPGVFVVMSLLEVGQAMAGDYDSATERKRAVDSAVRNAAINTGCLLVGEALIATMNPIGIVAGAVIMFFGPAIIGLLVGDDAPEKLLPDEVGKVDETLTTLVAEYEAVIGAIVLAGRDPAQRADVGLKEDISAAAKTSVLMHRMRALDLESQILPAFEAAYARVRGGRAGLREVDQMRQRFLGLRARASTDESDEEARVRINLAGAGGSLPADLSFFAYIPEERDASGQVIPIRELTLNRFKAMESKLSLDSLSVAQVRGLEQWSSIRESAWDLIKQVQREQPVDPDWNDLSQRQHDLEARLISARYRLNPLAQFDNPTGAARHVPLLKEGTPQRQAYEEELRRAEQHVRSAETMVLRAHWVNFRIEGIETPNIDGLGTGGPGIPSISPAQRRLEVADDGLDLYEKTMQQMGGPPESVGGVEALYREPAARRAYMVELESNRPYRKLLRRLEVTETATDSLLRSLTQELRAPPGTDPTAPVASGSPAARLSALQARFRRLRNERKVRKGILFVQEVQELHSQAKDRAVAHFLPLLAGRSGEQPLSREELVALRTGDFGAAGSRLLTEHHSMASRLALIPDLRAPTGPTELTDSSGTTIQVSRTLRGIMRLDGLTSSEPLLVGVVAHPVPGMTSVIALNDAAAAVLGGYGTTLVVSARLLGANETDL